MNPFTCVNCGAKNDLGDCCPECARIECDRCDELLELDEDILIEDRFTGDTERVCSDCFNSLTDRIVQ